MKLDLHAFLFRFYAALANKGVACKTLHPMFVLDLMNFNHFK